MKDNPFALKPGARLDDGKIVIEKVLGSGGFGTTYQARDEMYGEVALKEFLPVSMITGRTGLEPDVNEDKRQLYDKCLRSFCREARLLASLHHENIVSVKFSLEENKTAYYGMELMKGRDLADYLRERAPIDAYEAYDLFLPVMDALIYLHRNKALHRDISPDNIFLRETKEGISPCLIDFGAAFSAQRDFTHTFPRVKKNGYSPMEQSWDSKYQGTWSDVYAMTATVYYAVTGSVPRPAAERGTVENDALVKPRSLNPSLSKAMESFLLKGLALLPQDRIRGMAEFKKEWEKALDFPGVRNPSIESEADQARKEIDNFPEAVFSESSIVSDLENSETYSEKPNSSFAHFLALLLDWGICWILPTVIISILSGPGVGVAIGTAFSFLMNGLILMARGCTLGEFLAGCMLPELDRKKALVYLILRHIIPLSLADEINRSVKGESFLDSLVMSRPDSSYVSRSGTASEYTSMRESLPRLRCVKGTMAGLEIILDGMKTVGRGQDMTLKYPDEETTVSRHHCAIRRMKDGWHVVDMDSRNGTFVNDKRLQAGVLSSRLKAGDRLKVGNDEYIFMEE